MQIGWRQGRRIEKLLPYSFWVLTRWPGSWRVPPQHGQAFRGSEGRIDLDGNGWWQEDFHVHKVDNAYEIFIVRLFFIPLLLITMSVQLFVRHNILFAGHFLLLRAIYFLCRRNVFFIQNVCDEFRIFQSDHVLIGLLSNLNFLMSPDIFLAFCKHNCLIAWFKEA